MKTTLLSYQFMPCVSYLMCLTYKHLFNFNLEGEEMRSGKIEQPAMERPALFDGNTER